MQTAQFTVEIAETGGEAGDVTDLMKCTLGALDRLGQREFERHEAAVLIVSLGCQLKQRLFGVFDLASRIQFGIGTEGVVDHRLADVDQLPA